MQWGNIHDSSLAQILENHGLDELEQRSQVLARGDCRGCTLFPICHGGCPIDGYVRYGSFSRKTGWCAGKKRFVRRYFEPTTGIKVENLADYTE